MAKRTFAVLLVAWALGFPGPQTSAREISIDGCAKLARAVYSEVYAAAAYGPGWSGPWLINSDRGDIVVCKHASKTVSRAYTSAMLSAGIDVLWSGGDNDPGDYCLGAFLSQCYPNRYPLDTSMSVTTQRYVQNSWTAVMQSVMREMHNPISSNEVRFRDDDLRLRLGLSLRSLGGRGEAF